MRLALLLLLFTLALPTALLAAERAKDPPPPLPPPIPTATPQPLPSVTPPGPGTAPLPPVRRSRAAGRPWAGRLINGRPLPERGLGYLTWDPIHKRIPNREWRRYGTGRLLRTIGRVLAGYDAGPVLVGDLSRPDGGDFGPRFGGIGHASHQNGLDVDIYYRRRDGRLRPPLRPEQVDRKAAQALVDAFVRAGAEKIFVGPSLGLRGPRSVVMPLVHHDNHIHVRLPR